MIQSVALTYGQTKDAALYFDAVIPLTSSIDWMNDIRSGRSSGISKENHWAPWPFDIYGAILPKSLANDKDFLKRLQDLNENSFSYFLSIFKKFILEKDIPFETGTIEDFEALPLDVSLEKMETGIDALIRDFKLNDGNHFILNPEVSQGTADQDDVSITLARLNIIDTSQTSWEQIAEFRKDAASIAKLRRLRIFVSSSYEGRDASYIRDDLETRIYDYEEEVKRWGFETKDSALSLLFESKSLKMVGAASFVAILYGAPIAAILGASGGAAIEVGKIALEVARKKVAMRKSLGGNPVSYLAEARKKLVE